MIISPPLILFPATIKEKIVIITIMWLSLDQPSCIAKFIKISIMIIQLAWKGSILQLVLVKKVGRRLTIYILPRGRRVKGWLEKQTRERLPYIIERLFYITE